MGNVNNLQVVDFNPRIEMGSLEGKSFIEPQDEGLSGSVSNDRNMLSVKGVAVNCDRRSLWSRVITSIKITFFSDKINLLIPFGPLAMLVDNMTNHHGGWVFFLSLLGIIPLAERLGWATEQLAFFTGHTVGGFLNATFGNATELIISMYAMKHGMLRVVQQSLLGSILSNMLLVLGCAFFCGGIFCPKKEQVYNKSNAVMSSGLLLMAVMGLLFPAVLHFTHTELHFGKSELALSRFSSCIMLIAYGAYLFFQLTNQKNSYSPISEVGDRPVSYRDGIKTPQNEANLSYFFCLLIFKMPLQQSSRWFSYIDEASLDDENSDAKESPDISKWESIIWLTVLTLSISVLSEYLVNTIEGASVALNIPIAFTSVILLPIVGNAAEHASAIMFAVKNKLDISLGVAIGSSTQISMFVIPFCVVVGWVIGCPLDLNFQLFETATLFMTVLVVAFMLQDGTSNYFKGLMLVFCYLIVAASFFVHIDPQSIQDKP